MLELAPVHSQTLIVWSTSHETILEPSGENFTSVIDWPYLCSCAFVFSLLSSSDAAVKQVGTAHEKKRGEESVGVSAASQSQTLIVSEEAPETIFEPSGENATDIIPKSPADASVTSAVSSRDAAARQRGEAPRTKNCMQPHLPQPRQLFCTHPFSLIRLAILLSSVLRLGLLRRLR